MKGRLSRPESLILPRQSSALESHIRTHACIPSVLRWLLSSAVWFLRVLPPHRCIPADLGHERCIRLLLAHTIRRISFLQPRLLQYSRQRAWIEVLGGMTGNRDDPQFGRVVIVRMTPRVRAIRQPSASTSLITPLTFTSYFVPVFVSTARCAAGITAEVTSKIAHFVGVGSGLPGTGSSKLWYSASLESQPQVQAATVTQSISARHGKARTARSPESPLPSLPARRLGPDETRSS
jgi:hypothetical protein